jgi:hypothetical protein
MLPVGQPKPQRRTDGMLRAHEGAQVEKPDPRVIDRISGSALHRHVTISVVRRAPRTGC